MALFDVRCLECGFTDSILLKHSESLPLCPTCNSELDKVITNTSIGFDLKGTGYYVTDFKNNH